VFSVSMYVIVIFRPGNGLQALRTLFFFLLLLSGFPFAKTLSFLNRS